MFSLLLFSHFEIQRCVDLPKEKKQPSEQTKFNVSKDVSQRTYDGIVFASIMEMAFYRDVVLPQSRSGNIKHFELQKEYVLQPEYMIGDKKVRPIIYVADFYIEYADGRVEVIDTKGCPDSVAKIKRKMFMYIYRDTPYRWLTYVKKYGGWQDYDVIQRLRREAKRAANGGKKENKENEVA